jgi:hypothetical protein
MANMTKRDSALIKKIAEIGMLSTKQIGEFFFKGVDIRTVLRRLRKLEAANLLRRMIGLDTKECLWMVTASGAESSSVEIFKTKWSKNMVEHDYKLISLRLLLEGAGIAHSWIPEHEIRSQVFRKYGMKETKNKLIPDGLIGVLVNKKMESVAIELELTLKDKRRYRNIFNQYQDKKNLHAVWYIVPSNSILKSLKENWKKNYSSYSGIRAYFSLLSDLMKNPLEAKVIGSNSVYKVSELFFPKEVLPAHRPAHDVGTLVQSNLENKMQLTSEIHTPILGFSS